MATSVSSNEVFEIETYRKGGGLVDGGSYRMLMKARVDVDFSECLDRYLKWVDLTGEQSIKETVTMMLGLDYPSDNHANGFAAWLLDERFARKLGVVSVRIAAEEINGGSSLTCLLDQQVAATARLKSAGAGHQKILWQVPLKNSTFETEIDLADLLSRGGWRLEQEPGAARLIVAENVMKAAFLGKPEWGQLVGGAPFDIEIDAPEEFKGHYLVAVTSTHVRGKEVFNFVAREVAALTLAEKKAQSLAISRIIAPEDVHHLYMRQSKEPLRLTEEEAEKVSLLGKIAGRSYGVGEEIVRCIGTDEIGLFVSCYMSDVNVQDVKSNELYQMLVRDEQFPVYVVSGWDSSEEYQLGCFVPFSHIVIIDKVRSAIRSIASDHFMALARALVK